MQTIVKVSNRPVEDWWLGKEDTDAARVGAVELTSMAEFADAVLELSSCCLVGIAEFVVMFAENANNNKTHAQISVS